MVLGHDFNSWGVETRRGSIPPLRRPAACHAGVSWWIACPGSRCTTAPAALRPACTCGHGLVGGRHHHHWNMPTATLTFQCGRGESGWCSDMTSTHGVWRHTGVQFLLSGAFLMLACVFGPQHVNTGSQWSVWCRTTADKTVVMCRIEAPWLLCCTF